MPDENILLAIYKENADQARQHELFRQAITTLVAGITGAVIGLSLKDASAALQGPLLTVAGIFLTIMGGFGLIASMKHYERNRMHVQRIRAIRNALDALPGVTPQLLQNINSAADAQHRQRFPRLAQTELNKVWNTFHVLVMALGIALAILPCIYSPRIGGGARLDDATAVSPKTATSDPSASSTPSSPPTDTPMQPGQQQTN